MKSGYKFNIFNCFKDLNHFNYDLKALFIQCPAKIINLAILEKLSKGFSIFYMYSFLLRILSIDLN